MKLSDDEAAAAVRKLALSRRERGYVTYEELSAVLPPGLVSSEQIEDALCLLSELGIELVEKPLCVQPAKGEIDYAKLSREHVARYPKIRARLAE